MEKYNKIIIKYPSEIKIGDLILFRPDTICKVIKINKKRRRSRENGFPYEFIGEHNGIIYKQTYYYDVIKYVINTPYKKLSHFSDMLNDKLQSKYTDEQFEEDLKKFEKM